MDNNEINIELRASGGNNVVGELGRISRSASDLIVNVKKLGNVFGELGGNIAGLVQNILKGGVFGIVQSVIQLGVSAFSKWRDAAAKAAEEAKEAERKASEEALKSISDYAAAIDKAYEKRNAAINERVKSIHSEIDATKELIKATLELEKARARKSGDANAVESLQRQIDQVDADTAAEKIMADMEAAAKRTNSARRMAKSARIAVESAEMNANFEGSVLADAIENVRRDAAAAADKPGMFIAGGGYVAPRKATDAERKAAADSAEAAFRKSEEFKELEKRQNAANDKVKDLKDKYSKAKDEIKAAAKEEENLAKRADALIASQEAKQINDEQDKYESDRKAADERAKAEIKAAQDAAKERDRLDRELHQKRMADLKAEIEKQKEAAAPLQAVAAAAQTEFDRAFAMYRDPEKAQEQIAEERDYAADLKQLHKDANRYGGKWRIDELSQLMSAGDTQGVTDTLERWRKNKNFTPQVEAMVRASAAEQTKTTAEDELRKLNDKTERLVADLKDLSDTRDAKLDGIERNTNQLANKLDELLSVKG